MSVVSVRQSSVLGTVAHELRGPLSALQMTSELLDRDFDLLEPQQVKVMISSIHRRALWLRGLMENLLTSASISDGRLQVVRRPTNMRNVVEDIRPIVEPLLGRTQQRLRIRSSAQLPMVAGDERRLAQVLINLITNASKYSGIKTTIDLTIGVRSGQVRVAVADRGPGIPAEVADRLFEPYYRAGRTDGDGMGIGLSVVRSIIEAHGGHVGVKNRPAGGSCFWFELVALESVVSSESSENETHDYETHDYGRRIG